MEILNSINAGNRLLIKWTKICRFAGSLIVPEDRNSRIKRRKLRLARSAGHRFLSMIKVSLRLCKRISGQMDRNDARERRSRVLHQVLLEDLSMEVAEVRRFVDMFDFLQQACMPMFKEWWFDFRNLRGHRRAREI